jgi:hypothetical protein
LKKPKKPLASIHWLSGFINLRRDLPNTPSAGKENKKE